MKKLTGCCEGILLVLLANMPMSAEAGICFLPDCESKVNSNNNNGADTCRKNGYTPSQNLVCEDKAATMVCPQDDGYIKCDKGNWCVENGFGVTSCQKPKYLMQQCDNGELYYKECMLDNDRACREDGYVNSCVLPQKLEAEQRCQWNNAYGKCCTPNNCPPYTSLSGTYGNSGSTDGCGYACKYTCDMSCPAGTVLTSPGGCGGSTVNGCGNKTCYYAFKACCGDQYKYNSSNCLFPNKLAGTVCDGKYSDCIMDENNINCDNFKLPATASYIKAAYTCDDLRTAINSRQAGNIVIMKSLSCPGSLNLISGQNLVGIGYFLDTNSSLYKNQLNQCSVLQLNDYLYTSGNNKISDITLNNSPLYLKGATDIHNMNMKIASAYSYAVQGRTSPASAMSGIVNIYTPGSVALYNVNMTMTDTRLNLRPAGGINRGFRLSDINTAGNTVINMDLSGASGNGEAVVSTNLYLRDNTSLNIRTNSYQVEAFNGDNTGTIDNVVVKTYIQSSNVVIRAYVSAGGTYTFVNSPYFSYVSGAEIMTISGLYRATGNGGLSSWGNSNAPVGSWSRIGSYDFSANSAFGKEMEIFNLNFFK